MKIFKYTLYIPIGLSIVITESSLKMEGPLGSIIIPLSTMDPYGIIFIKIINDNSKEQKYIEIIGNSSHSKIQSLFPSIISKFKQMIDGVSRGVFTSLELIGVGYRAQLESNFLDLKLGHSHPIQYPINPSMKIVQKKPTEIALYGIDKQYVRQVAADLRYFRPPEVYKGKGIRYHNECIKIKQGKKK
uniref:Ribosomal protein L6 n=1 Tax=Nephroselmis olivacea TaxID=31312 RepID=Q9TCB6_NEPOL|nr:ribosomal protein L6 [Nephroselmis olivacea]AAF03181.1 ribosomal protein L6 [Nephroselmis olivacea]